MLTIDKPNIKAEKRAKEKALRDAIDEFNRLVFLADDGVCVAHDCPYGEGDTFMIDVFDQHHVLSKGSLGYADNNVDNGMNLHRYPCHYKATEGFKRNGKRVTARQYVLEIIAHHEKKGTSRWDRVKAILLRKER